MAKKQFIVSKYNGVIMQEPEQVCEICGYPIQKYGKEEKLVLYMGKYYCEDRCLSEAQDEIESKQIQSEPIYKLIYDMFGYKMHVSEIVDLIRILRKKFNIKPK